MTSLVVLVNGASASGKSRLIAGVQSISRDSAVVRGIRVAQRVTTRAAREHESLPGENHYLQADVFDTHVQAGKIDVHWDREIAEGHVNRYGFSLAPELERPGIVLLSGNNYLDWPNQALLASLRAQHRLMVVRVWASPETRVARLAARRPELSDAELSSRIADVPPGQLPAADHAVLNDPEFQRHAEWEFLRLVAEFRFSARPTPIDPSEPPAAAGWE